MFNTTLRRLMVAVILSLASTVGSAYAVDTCSVGGASSSAAGALRGTYNFAFHGSVEYHSGNFPTVGSGSFKLDGNGNVIGGTLTVNCAGLQTGGKIVGGCYAVNGPTGLGFMSLELSPPASSCFLDPGVDLDFASNGAGIFFASDGSEENFSTGAVIPFAGVATKTSNSTNN